MITKNIQGFSKSKQSGIDTGNGTSLISSSSPQSKFSFSTHKVTKPSQNNNNKAPSSTGASGSSLSLALTELSSMKSALRTLQRDSVEQIELEVQTQATFEHFGSQLISLRKSFNTLADLVVNETEALWKISDDKESKIRELLLNIKSLEEDVESLRRATSTLTNICHENQLQIINELNTFDGRLQKFKQLEPYFNQCLTDIQSSVARHECEMSILKQDSAQKESNLLYLHREINKLKDTFQYYKRKKPPASKKILQQRDIKKKEEYDILVTTEDSFVIPNTHHITKSNDSDEQQGKVIYFKEKEKQQHFIEKSSDNEDSDRSCSDLPTVYLTERVALLEQQVQQLIASNNQLNEKVYELEKNQNL